MKRLKLTFWILGFGCGMVVTGIIGTLLSLNIEVDTTKQSDKTEQVSEIKEESLVQKETGVLETVDAKETLNETTSINHTLSSEGKLGEHAEEQGESQETQQVEISQNEVCEITIPSDLSASQICEILEKNNIVESGKDFLAYVKERKKQTYMQSGHYTLPIHADYEELLEQLIS